MVTLVEQVAVALYGDFAAGSEPCMALARKACEAVAKWLEGSEAHERLCEAVQAGNDVTRASLWRQQRVLAAAVRGEDRPCPDAKEKKDDGVA